MSRLETRVQKFGAVGRESEDLASASASGQIWDVAAHADAEDVKGWSR